MAEDTREFNISPRIEELQKKLDRDPDSNIFLPLAEEYRKSGMLEEAITICQEGLTKHPNYVSARVVLGRAYMDLKRMIEAQAEFEEVISKIPDNLTANKYLGDIYFLQGNLKSALERYQTVASVAPYNKEVASKVKDILEKLDQQTVIDVPPAELPGETQATSEEEQPEEPTEEREEKPPEMLIDLTEEESSLPISEEKPEEPPSQAPQPIPPLPEESSPPPPLEEPPAAPSEPELPATEEEEDELATATIAELYAKQGLFDKAIKVYEQLFEANPDNRELKFRYEQLLDLKKREEARKEEKTTAPSFMEKGEEDTKRRKIESLNKWLETLNKKRPPQQDTDV